MSIETSIDGYETNLRSDFGKRGWAVVAIQGVMFWFASGMAAHGLNVVLPVLTQEYGLEHTTLLAWATPAAGAGVVAGFFFAKLADRKGAKFTILLCLAMSALAYGLLGNASSVTVFVLLFGATNFFATGFGYIAGPSLIANWFPLKKDLAFGWTTIGQATSSAFYVPLLALFLTLLGTRYGFWGVSALLAVLFVIIMAFVTNRPEEAGCYPDNDPHSSEKLAALRAQALKEKGVAEELTTGRLLRNKDVWLLGIASGCVYIVLVGVTSQIVPRLMALGYEFNTAIYYMSISALIGVPGAYFWGWIGQALSTKKALVVYMLWWLVAVLFNLFELNQVTLWIFLLMVGFSLGGATNLTTSIVATKFPRELFVKAFGLIHPLQGIIRSLSFSVVALGLAVFGSYAGAYALIAGICVLTIILFWLTDTTPIA